MTAGAPTPMIHVFMGTMAEYIKTAPLLRLMDAKGIEYRLIDAGQHGLLNAEIRRRLEVREPDVCLGDDRDMETIGEVIKWSAGLARRLGDRRWLRDHVFGGHTGVCVVHGDTPSTLLASLMAHRAGVSVAHIEAGLRSGSVLNPFPEEMVRRVVMRLAELLFAPDAVAVGNLHRMRAKGEVVPLPANTVVEALAHDLEQADVDADVTDVTGIAPDHTRADVDGPVVATLHRVENLKRGDRVRLFHDTLVRIARERPVTFCMHGPTIAVMRPNGMEASLRAAGVEIRGLASHREFLGMIAGAPYVITDGGSIQEECALLGVPTLLWRKVSERPDGIGSNVVVSQYDEAVIAAFLADPARYATPPADLADLTLGRDPRPAARRPRRRWRRQVVRVVAAQVSPARVNIAPIMLNTAMRIEVCSSVRSVPISRCISERRSAISARRPDSSVRRSCFVATSAQPTGGSRLIRVLVESGPRADSRSVYRRCRAASSIMVPALRRVRTQSGRCRPQWGPGSAGCGRGRVSAHVPPPTTRSRTSSTAR